MADLGHIYVTAHGEFTATPWLGEKAQFGLRMQHATQQLANISQIKKVRRDIARVRTVMKEKTAK